MLGDQIHYTNMVVYLVDGSVYRTQDVRIFQNGWVRLGPADDNRDDCTLYPPTRIQKMEKEKK